MGFQVIPHMLCLEACFDQVDMDLTLWYFINNFMCSNGGKSCLIIKEYNLITQYFIKHNYWQLLNITCYC